MKWICFFGCNTKKVVVNAQRAKENNRGQKAIQRKKLRERDIDIGQEKRVRIGENKEKIMAKKRYPCLLLSALMRVKQKEIAGINALKRLERMQRTFQARKHKKETKERREE